MTAVKKVLKWIDINFEPILIFALFVTFATLIVVQVILRFVFKEGISWAEEIGAFLFVWSVFLAISYTFKTNKHVGVDFIRNALPVPVRKIITIVSDVLLLVMLVFLLQGSISNVQRTAEFGDNAQSIAISMNYLYSAAVLGFGASIIRVIQTLIWKLVRYKASYELFLNVGGVYNGADRVVLISKSFKDEIHEHLNKELVEEEKSYKKFLD